MINAAVIQNDTIVNIIYIDRANFRRFKRLGIQLEYAEPLGLAIGDTKNGADFYRNGEKLPMAAPSE